MASRDIIVIGTSTGGVDALTRVARGLPAGFPASLFVVCHIPPGARSVLPDILSRAGPLLATFARDGDPFYPGHVYVAPPDRHLLLGAGNVMRVTRGARENNHRPAADPLFRSAARHYGPRAVGVVLTGGLNDGAAGLMAVRAAGGVAVAQDPADALVAAMPQTAADVAGADYRVAADDLPALLVELVRRPITQPPGGRPMDPIERMPDAVEKDMGRQARNERRGAVSTFTCPECGGSLWQVDDTGRVRFRCHVGHAYDGELLFTEQGEKLEAALWTAVRTFREKAVLGRQLAARERANGNPDSAARFEEQAAQSEEYGRLILRNVLDGDAGRGPG